jgi:sec-independent protein translocase protein TatB
VTAEEGKVSLLLMSAPETIQMANLGFENSLILMVLALVVFGPRRLPQIGRQIGKLMYEFRKASNDFKFQMEEELRVSEDADRRKKEEERVKALAAATPAPAVLVSAAGETAVIESPELEAAAPAIVGTTYDSLYPRETPATTIEPAAAEPSISEPAAPEPEIEAALPRIMPPSTGDPVEAQRPNRKRIAEETSEETPEQTAHHG